MDVKEMLGSIVRWLLSSGLQIVVILVLMLIALRLTRTVSTRMFAAMLRDKEDLEAKKRTDTLSAVIRYVMSVAIIVVALLMIMKEIGFDIGPVLAAAGVVGLAVGFGAQSLVKDVISGYFILLQDQIRVGDVVRISDRSGVVESISLKMTTLRDLAGNVHFVPNGEIGVVTNMTKEYSRFVFDIGVAYREDVDHVVQVVRQIDEELRMDPEFKEDILEPIEILGLDQFADSAVIIKARTKTVPLKQWRVGREFNRRMKKKFDEMNIEIPFPHVTLYLGQDQRGAAPPLRVALQDKGVDRPEAPRGAGGR